MSKIQVIAKKAVDRAVAAGLIEAGDREAAAAVAGLAAATAAQADPSLVLEALDLGALYADLRA